MIFLIRPVLSRCSIKQQDQLDLTIEYISDSGFFWYKPGGFLFENLVNLGQNFQKNLCWCCQTLFSSRNGGNSSPKKHEQFIVLLPQQLQGKEAWNTLNLACPRAKLVTSFECFVYFSVLWTHVGQLKGAQLFPDQLIEFVVSTSGACSP